MTTPEPLDQRKAALRAEQRRRRRARGVACAAQEVEEVPAGPRDQPLDAMVTARAVHRGDPTVAGFGTGRG